MLHTITPTFTPLTVTINLQTEAEAILFWTTLAGATKPKLCATAERNLSSENHVKLAIALNTGASLYHVWDELDDLLRATGVISGPEANIVQRT